VIPFGKLIITCVANPQFCQLECWRSLIQLINSPNIATSDKVPNIMLGAEQWEGFCFLSVVSGPLGFIKECGRVPGSHAPVMLGLWTG
jgi:hypothetical protein